MNLSFQFPFRLAALLLVGLAHQSKASDSLEPFIGRWAFELPDGGPAWLQVNLADGKPKAWLLWSVGSARAASEVRLQGESLLIQRNIRWKPYGKSDGVRIINLPMITTVSGNSIRLSVIQSSKKMAEEKYTLTGKRMPPIPPKPNLEKIKYGKPIRLFNGRDLTGWKLANARKKNGWHVKNGVLVNETPKTDFGAYGDYGNLVTTQNFEDFRLTIEYNVPEGGNSGVYLRGMYEAQVVDRDSKMQGIQGPGAIFGRIKPVENAGKPGSQWNRYDLLLVDQHLSVTLNGKKVIDNQPILGCTGGGISADDTKAGPILLQGDHTSIKYRNIVLHPVIK